jgi:hypothetical protein
VDSKAEAARARAAAVVAAGEFGRRSKHMTGTTETNRRNVFRLPLGLIPLALVCALSPFLSPTAWAQSGEQRTFASPEDAVKALIEAVKAGNVDTLRAIFGPEGQELFESSDPAEGRRNREVFAVAAAEQWRLMDDGPNRKTLVIGGEEWPFPVPLAKGTSSWRFDTAAGKEEVLARRIGRNELAAIQTSLAYVTAQQRYAQQGHDGKPAGLYAAKFESDPGKENGLYWPTARGQKRSPIGDLLAKAAEEGRQVAADRTQPSPLNGYLFKILTVQGPAAPGGAKAYVAGGDMSGGFALVAWPAQYDLTGVMTFVVNHDGIVYQKDLGPGTDAAARKMSSYNPDPSWHQAR